MPFMPNAGIGPLTMGWVPIAGRWRMRAVQTCVLPGSVCPSSHVPEQKLWTSHLPVPPVHHPNGRRGFRAT